MPTIRQRGLAGPFAWTGAFLFVVALLYFLYTYLVRFGRPGGSGQAALSVGVNLLLFSSFALHHSLLARPRPKAWVRSLVPPPLERSVYTWTSSILFILVCAWWRQVPGDAYHLTGPLAAAGYAIQAAALLLTARASSRLDVLDLAGVRQVLTPPGRKPEHVALETTGLYGFVRHPVYFAWALFVFGTPHMTATRLTFAVISTAYIMLAIPFEERTLVQAFGDDYLSYRRKVRWRMLPGVY